MDEVARVIRMVEYRKSSAPVALPRDEAETIAERLSKYLRIDPAWEAPGTYWLTARQFIGDLVIGTTHIHIRSAKAPLPNVMWMLGYVGNLAHFRHDLRAYDKDVGLLEYLVAAFASQVENLERHGLHRAYVQHRGDQSRLRGRLDLLRHVRGQIVHPERFAVRWSQHTADVAENQLLKHVLISLAGIRYRSIPRLRQRVHHIVRAFDHVEYVPIAERDFDAVRFHPLNRHYEGPLALARLLWRHLHVRFSQGSVPFATFLVDLNRLFEAFIAAYLSSYLRRIDAASELRAIPQYTLTLDEKGLEQAYVDIVLAEGEHDVLAVDTKFKKYKDGPARADLYQMYTYCRALGIQSGILLYPAASSIRDARHIRGVAVRARSVWLGGTTDDLERNMKEMARELCEEAELQRVYLRAAHSNA